MKGFKQTLAFQIGLPIFIFALIATAFLGFLIYERHTLLSFIFGLSLFIFLGYEIWVFRRYFLLPLRDISKGIHSIEAGNYTNLITTSVENELTEILPVINRINQKLLVESPEDVEKLKGIVNDLNNSTKLLVQRDLELSRANEKLRDLDRMKSEFVSLATHQLRTPLSGVRWSLSMLLNGEMGELTAEQKLYVMKTYESNNRMITLINDMLQTDRIDAGTIKFKFTPTNLLYLFENVLTELKPLAEKRDLKLNFKPVDHIPPIMIDPENMRIVLQNLVDNAIKYSREGGEVNITVGKTDTDVTISIQDQGIGIPLENQPNIFKRFFRAPNAVHVETDGSGLGLYIVESIIQRHHGTINFESKENEGTTFFIKLPISDNT